MREDQQRRHAPRRQGRAKPRNGRRPGPRRPAPSAGPSVRAPESELDRAIAAALAAPAPEPTTFAALGLPEPLVSALTARGIQAPFAIQARALPDALAGRDVLGKAQTGSGKTLAFGLPMLARLASRPAPAGGNGRTPRRRERAPRGLVLVPTRELAGQVAEVLEPLGRSLAVTVTTVYGGVSIGRQIDRLRRGVDVVVATPGRLLDLMNRGACVLEDIEITVLDEADHMADLGFLPDVTRILDATPATAQRLLFSATLDRGVGTLVTSYLTNPAICAVAPAVIDTGSTEHSVLVLAAEDKVQVAAEIASRPARTLFFVRTKHGADRLAKQFGRAGVAAAAIHGNLSQSQRRRALDGFAAGAPRVLVATDVAARGIHVDDVELVVHFDPPNDHKDYLHRSGRTARAGADGMVVALVEEAQVRDVERLHRSAGISPTRHHVAAGHDVVRKIATSGTPVPPPPARPDATEPGAQTRAQARRAGSRPGASSRDGRPARRSGAAHSGAAGKRGRPRRGGGRPDADVRSRPGRGAQEARSRVRNSSTH